MKTVVWITILMLVGLPLSVSAKKGKKTKQQVDNGKGLVAHYYADPEKWGGNWSGDAAPTVNAKDWTFTKYSYTRIESHVNHFFQRRGWFSVRWQGVLNTNPRNGNDVEADYSFRVLADDGCRLILDGKTLIDSWKPTWEKAPEAWRIAKVRLKPGAHTIVLEYFQGQSLKKKDRDPIKLYWECPARKIPKQIIPAAYFTHSKADLTPKQGRMNATQPDTFIHKGKKDKPWMEVKNVEFAPPKGSGKK